METCENDNSLTLVEKNNVDEVPDLEFAGFEPNYYYQNILRAGEREVIVDNVEN